MAIEDGAVLGTLFTKITNKSQISDILTLYEWLRKSRTTNVVQKSIEQGALFKLHDGEKQRERDRSAWPIWTFDPEFREWLYDHDCIAEAVKAWEGSLGWRGDSEA